MLPWISGVTTSKEDTKKLSLLRQLNQVLENFANDEAFQLDLQRPMVQLAFDNWSGKAVHNDRAAEIRKCSAVTAVYPKVKALELLCTQVSIKVVLEHIQARKSELNTNGMVLAFGEKFVREQGLYKESPKSILLRGDSVLPQPNQTTDFFALAASPEGTSVVVSSKRGNVISSDEEAFNVPNKSKPPASAFKKVDSKKPVPADATSSSVQVPIASPVQPKSSRSEISVATKVPNLVTFNEDSTWIVRPSPMAASSINNKKVVKEAAPIPQKTEILSSDTKSVPASNTSLMLVMFAFYITCITSSLIYSGRYDADATVHMPWVGKSNATNVVLDRLKVIETDFEGALQRDQWKVIRNESDITIETMEAASSEWPMYVRVSTLVPVVPAKAYSFFQTEKYHATMQKIDPFYESSKDLFSPDTKFFFQVNGVRIIKKISSPIFKFFSRRELTVAAVEKTQGKSFKLRDFPLPMSSSKLLSSNGELKVARGTLVMAGITVNYEEEEYTSLFTVTVNRERSPDLLKIGVASGAIPLEESSFPSQCDEAFLSTMSKLSVKIETKICSEVAAMPSRVMSSITKSLRYCDGLVTQWIHATTRYKKMRHDVLSYFVPTLSGGTLIVAVMRLDPGDDIPRMALETLVRTYGGNVLKAIGSLSEEVEK